MPGKLPPLEKSDLKSQEYLGGRDGDIMINRIKAFLEEKQLPKDKKDLIIRTLENTLLAENINKVLHLEAIFDDRIVEWRVGRFE